MVAVGEPPIFRQQVAHALDASTESIVWMPSLTAAEQLFQGDPDGPDVLVISPAVEDGDALALAQLANRYAPTTAVVLVGNGDRTVNGLLPSFMRAGIRDVVNLDVDDLADSLRRAQQWAGNLRSSRADDGPGAANKNKVVTVFSSKGGTGKTFLASNLAASIASRGVATAIVDLDMAMGDVFAYFGAEPERSIRDLPDLGRNLDSESLLSVSTKLADNLYGFGAPSDPGAAQVPPEDVAGILRAMRRHFPCTVIDVPAGYSEEVLQALDISDSICVVAMLDVVGIKHLAKAIETFQSLGIDSSKLVVALNRADSKVGLELSDVEKVTKLKIEALIPSSRDVPTSLNRGRPIFIEDPKSNVSQAIRKLADRLVPAGEELASGEEGATKRSRFGLMFGKA